MRILPWLVPLLAAGMASAQEAVLKLDAAQTRVEFTLADVLHTVHGAFTLKSGSLRFDPATGKASGELVIDAASGDSGNGARDGRMKKSILEVSKFPDVTLTPDRFEGSLNLQGGESQLKLHGAFGIHGAQHEITMPVKVNIQGQQLTADTDFPVPYVNWGMKNPSTLFLRCSDTVQIHIHAVGKLEP